jgi:hypothetical protein
MAIGAADQPSQKGYETAEAYVDRALLEIQKELAQQEEAEQEAKAQAAAATTSASDHKYSDLQGSKDNNAAPRDKTVRPDPALVNLLSELSEATKTRPEGAKEGPQQPAPQQPPANTAKPAAHPGPEGADDGAGAGAEPGRRVGPVGVMLWLPLPLRVVLAHLLPLAMLWYLGEWLRYLADASKYWGPRLDIDNLAWVTWSDVFDFFAFWSNMYFWFNVAAFARKLLGEEDDTKSQQKKGKKNKKAQQKQKPKQQQTANPAGGASASVGRNAARSGAPKRDIFQLYKELTALPQRGESWQVRFKS